MSDQDDIDASRAPLMDHLIELRRRLLISIGTLALLVIGCFFLADPIFAVLVHPLKIAGQTKLIYTKPFEAFFVNLKIGFFSGLILSFPVIANQLWQFVAPGLYRKEKRALLPFLLATPLLFAAGCAMAFYLAIPGALHFLLSYQNSVGGVQREALPSIDAYLDFVMQFLFGFGVAFLMPVLLMLIERAGIVTLRQLVRAWRYAVLGCFAVALFLAPPDAGSMVMLALPLVGLYILTLGAIWLTGRGRRRAQAADDEVAA